MQGGLAVTKHFEHESSVEWIRLDAVYESAMALNYIVLHHCLDPVRN